MDLSKLSHVISVSVVMVFTIALVGGCGQQDSASADQSQTKQSTEETSSEHEDHEQGHDEYGDDHSDHEDENDYSSDHYEGQKSENWDQAMANLNKNNQKLLDLLEKDQLSEYEMEQVHELTYTLENAIGQVREDLDKTADSLEELHLASEERNADRIRKNAEQYLESSSRLTN